MLSYEINQRWGESRGRCIIQYLAEVGLAEKAPTIQLYLIRHRILPCTIYRPPWFLIAYSFLSALETLSLNVCLFIVRIFILKSWYLSLPHYSIFLNHLPLCYGERKIPLSVSAISAFPPSRGHSREKLAQCHTAEDPSAAASVASHCLRQKLGHMWTTGVWF